jgi:phosphoribosylformylglycinamidine synthase
VHLVQVATRSGVNDAHAKGVLTDLEEAGLADIRSVDFVKCYLFSDGLDQGQIEKIARRLLVDQVAEEFTLNGAAPVPDGEGPKHAVLVLRKPGVMDPVALSLEDAILDMRLVPPSIRIGRLYLVGGDFPAERVLKCARRVVANEIIEEIRVDEDFPRSFPEPFPYEFSRVEVPVTTLDDDELIALSKRNVLSLNLVEMHTVQGFYRDLGREPTDVELETIAQTWSEHCKHKTLTGVIRFEGERIENLLKETVFKVTKEIDRDDCLSVFVDNAGVIRFDEKRAVCMKVETHNHPSAIEPFGGAGTGIGGVIRDIMGTGLGAWPILNTDVFCFGPPDMAHEDVPKGSLHPRRLMKGVVSGVRDYGNRMGIPTSNGAVYFDPRYVGNPLVYCGTVGVMPADKVDKAPRAGDLVLLAGGRTGRDGIHGVTFASIELDEDSEMMSAGAVQIGNPIEEKKILDAQIRARDLGLYTSVTDCGGGGLSSAVGEMGEEVGVMIDLERIPLKYEGLTPAEIWISEAQERMIFSVPPENRKRILEIFEAEESEATIIGRFTGDKRLTLRYDGQTVADLPMEFLHDGLPKQEREAAWEAPDLSEPEPEVADRWGDALRDILSMPNVASKEWIIRQYDHEVQGLTVLKPLVGVLEEGPGDAVVATVAPGESRGIVVSCGMNPHLGDLDPYQMAANAVDEAVRNSVAVGANPERIALLDNYSWGNCDKPDRLGAIVLASRALYDVAKVYGTPFISGKDSLNNEYQTEAGTICIPHTLLISAISVIDDVKTAVSMDLKANENLIYIVGETRNELGGSHLYLRRGETGANVPTVKPEEAAKSYRALHGTIASGLVRSCHDLSEGGLAVAVSEMAFAGRLGVGMDLSLIPCGEGCDRDDVLLFSETPSRFVVEVEERHRKRFESAMTGVVCTLIGDVNRTGRVMVRGVGSGIVLDESILDLREAFLAPLRW